MDMNESVELLNWNWSSGSDDDESSDEQHEHEEAGLGPGVDCRNLLRHPNSIRLPARGTAVDEDAEPSAQLVLDMLDIKYNESFTVMKAWGEAAVATNPGAIFKFNTVTLPLEKSNSTPRRSRFL
ncbi:hypothetical protein RI054_17g79820 [Pseudoscourfieldia marina]